MMLAMIHMHTMGLIMLLDQTTTRLIKLLQQQSFKTGWNKIMFCQRIIFVSLQTLQ
jgi:hypothetical protein